MDKKYLKKDLCPGYWEYRLPEDEFRFHGDSSYPEGIPAGSTLFYFIEFSNVFINSNGCYNSESTVICSKPSNSVTIPKINITSTPTIKKWLDGHFDNIYPVFQNAAEVPTFELKDQIGADDSCNHSWKNYYGLSEQFEHCELCGKKKD